MTEREFQRQPLLMRFASVAEITGLAPGTLRKYVENAVLVLVRPAGLTLGRFQKRQVAELLKMSIETDWEQFKREPMLMAEGRVTAWTGWGQDALAKMERAHGIEAVRIPGTMQARYRKQEIAELVGLKDCV